MLEGAAASSIYGDKAAAGVVLITTKKGTAGAPQVTATQRLGTNTLEHELDLRRFTLGQAYTQGAAVGLDSSTVLHELQRVRWILRLAEAALRRRRAVVRDRHQRPWWHGNTTYFVSGLDKYDNGLQLNTGYNKQSVRANLSQTFSSKVSASANLFYSSSLTRTGVNGNDNYSIAGYDVISYTPSWFNMAARNPNGSYVNNPFGTANAIADAYQIQTPDEVNRFTGGGTVTYEPISNASQSLKAVFVGGLDAVNERYEFYANPDLQVEREAPAVPGQATYLAPYGRLSNYSVSLVHVFSGLSWVTATTSAGYTRDQHQTYQLFTAGEGLASGQQNLQYALDQSVQLQQQNVINSGVYGQEQLQLLDSRLTLTGGINAERSTNNGNVNAYYPFPKASLSYRFSKLAGWLDELKLRFAYGQSGNTPTYGVRVTQDHQSLDGGQTGTTFGDTLGNPRIRPETSTDFETGFNATLFKGRGGFSLTLYQKQISNLLLLAGTPPATGCPVRMDQRRAVHESGDRAQRQRGAHREQAALVDDATDLRAELLTRRCAADTALPDGIQLRLQRRRLLRPGRQLDHHALGIQDDGRPARPDRERGTRVHQRMGERLRTRAVPAARLPRMGIRAVELGRHAGLLR